MMTIDLNLLSPAKKNRLRYLIKFLFSKDVLEVVLITVAIISVSLVWSWMILQESFTQLALSAATVDIELSAYRKETNDINQVIASATEATKGYQPIFPQINELITTLPVDIKLNSLTLDKKASKLTLSGVAKTEKALEDYKKILESINWVTPFELPASNPFKQPEKNIDFNWPIQITLPKPPGENRVNRVPQPVVNEDL